MALNRSSRPVQLGFQKFPGVCSYDHRFFANILFQKKIVEKNQKPAFFSQTC